MFRKCSSPVKRAQLVDYLLFIHTAVRATELLLQKTDVIRSYISLWLSLSECRCAKKIKVQHQSICAFKENARMIFSCIPGIVRKTHQNSNLCEFGCKFTICSKIEMLILLPSSSVIYTFVYSEEVRFVQLLYPFHIALQQHRSIICLLTELVCLIKKTLKWKTFPLNQIQESTFENSGGKKRSALSISYTLSKSITQFSLRTLQWNKEKEILMDMLLSVGKTFTHSPHTAILKTWLEESNIGFH